MKIPYFFSAVLAALTLLSCERESIDSENKPVEVNVTILGTAPTRVTAVKNANESKVKNLQVYVFNNGKLEDYQDAGAAMTAQLTATSGLRTVWALVNAPTLKNLTTESELKKEVSKLSDNKPDALVMVGSTSLELKDKLTVPITVKRFVSRVSIKKISTDFQLALASESVSIEGIYLINVAGDNTYASNGTPSTWVNQLKHKDSNYDALLYDKVTATVNNNKAYEKEHVFYPYPNPTEQDTYDASWAPRHTILVVEVTFQNKKGYYPVVLPVLERNKTYVIDEMILRHLPNDDPYKPLETGDASVQISVNEWEIGLNMGKITL
jgi:hypothetical protein